MTEIPAYTIDQLADLNLPGYGVRATLPQIANLATDWTPVLSLSIFRQHPDHPDRTQVLTGVRTSTTHDGVASTPTMRMRPPAARRLLWAKESFLERPFEQDMLSLDAPTTREVGTLALLRPNYERLTASQLLPRLVREALVYKLNMPNLRDTRFAGRDLGRVSLDQVLFGFSRVAETSSGDSLFEPLVMYGVSVELNEEGADLIPSENEKYRYLGWTEDSRTFYDDTRARDVFRLAPSAGDRAVAFCAYGLCLTTTRSITMDRTHAGQRPLKP